MKKGYLLLFIMILLTIIIVYIFGYLIKHEEVPTVVESNISAPLNKVTDRNNYYMVENCVSKLYKYYATMCDTKEDSDIEKMYILLDQEYINLKSITKENILEALPVMRDAVINITSMWESKLNENISIYIVEGILREELSKQLSDFKIMIKVDFKNETFSVFLQDYIQEKYNNIALGDMLEVEKLTNIESNRYNLYLREEISNETYVKSLINKYKEEALYNVKLAYEHIDEQYRNEKFGTLGKFEEYVKERNKVISNIELEKYVETQRDNYIQYFCTDKKGYNYIFRTTDIREYTLILDNYTIDIPEFLEKFNKTNVVGRVGYSIRRSLNAINDKDYSYVYNKLDFEFKALNYPTLESFEESIKANLFDRNEIKTISSHNEGSTYIFKLTISNVEDETQEQNMTVIIQLKEGTDFVMALSFQ